jgi:hypothetical protein
MNITYFKDLFKNTDVPYVVSIEKAIDRIKNGASKDTVEKIRSGQNDLKNTLPLILFAGEFSERNKDGCKKHSGLMVADFDKMPDQKEYHRIWNELKENKHIFLIFKSPSGNGIKAVIRIPEADKTTHTKYFKSFETEFNIDYWDKANSDISRICFESYDPELYYNPDAEIYDPILIDTGYSVNEYTTYTPVTDEEKIIDKIMQWNWSKDFVEGQRNEYLLSLAGVFCEYGISESTAYNYIWNNIVIGDFSETETKNVIKNAYKRRQYNSRFFEDYEKKKRLEVDVVKEKKEIVLKKYDITETDYTEIKDKVEHDKFWYFDDKEKVKVDPLKYKFFLERNGFKKFFHNDSQKPTWVKIESNKVSETSIEKIKDFVLNYLLEISENKVWSYCANYQTLFSENFLLMLETIELTMLKDKKEKSYLAFNNGILEVTKQGSKLIDYIDVNGYIWESQIIKRDFKIIQTHRNEYQTFIKNIAGEDILPIETVIGYLLSTYKNKMNNKAIILNDEVISDNPEGGTGKGLFVQGLRQIRKVSILDGKTFDDKKSFPYQTVSTETQVLVFDDVKKNWDFESKFSLVTEGITLERKNKDAIKLTVEESPKMLVSTNYAIKGEGNSHDRRRHEIEIAQYYGKELTPYDEFGRQLFDDWDLNEWQKFDNYMVSCLVKYLNKGLVEQKAVNIKLRKFIAETSMEFYEWIEDAENFPRNNRNEKQLYFNNFINEYKDFQKWLSRKRFAIWVQKYGNYKGLKFESGISQGFRWFEITDENLIKENDGDQIPF